MNVNAEPKKLTAAQRKRASDLIKEKMVDGKGDCDSCGKNSWSLAQGLWTPIAVDLLEPRGFGTNFREIIPMLLLMCTHCGNSKFIHTGFLGLDLDNGDCLPEVDADEQ